MCSMTIAPSSAPARTNAALGDRGPLAPNRQRSRPGSAGLKLDAFAGADSLRRARDLLGQALVRAERAAGTSAPRPSASGEPRGPRRTAEPASRAPRAESAPATVGERGRIDGGDLTVKGEAMSAEQRRLTEIVLEVGREMGANEKVLETAVATMIQESVIKNDSSVDTVDHDSLGLFQQRPSQGWGTREQISDPAYAARKFFEQAIANDRKDPDLEKTQLAQSVQRSAHPDRYAQWDSEAEAIVADFLGEGGSSAPQGPGSPAPTGGDRVDPSTVSDEASTNGLSDASLAGLEVAHTFGLPLVSGKREGSGTSDHVHGDAIDVGTLEIGAASSTEGTPQMKAFAEHMRQQGKAGNLDVKYVIADGMIASDVENWEWRPYTFPGRSEADLAALRESDRGEYNRIQHHDHVHVSFR